MNSTIIVTVIFALMIIVVNYEFSSIKLDKLKLYDFVFEDLIVYSTTTNGIDLYLKSKSGKVKNNKIQLSKINIIRDNNTLNNTKKGIEYIDADNMVYDDKNVFLDDNVRYQFNDISIVSKNIKYDLKTKIITAEKSIVKLGNNIIKSSIISLDIKNKNFDAKNAKLTLDLEDKLSL